ncbi:MAG: hypothetical protein IPN29_17905 [Saprospiraceae bacterium]|nr:hypothetical protein [Saprospiraceae bacterium]
MNLSILWLLFLNCYVVKPIHDVHVSVTEVNWESEGIINITTKLFYDDLQLAMGLVPGAELPASYPGADQMIKRYLDKNLEFYLDGKKIKPGYIKSRAALPAIWVEMTIPDSQKEAIKVIKVINRIFISQYDDQVNMVHFDVADRKSHFALDKKSTTAILNLQP